MTREPLGMPKGSDRALMSLAVVLTAAGVMAALLARELESDLTQVVVGGWIAALGNVIGFYLGTRAGERARDGLVRIFFVIVSPFGGCDGRLLLVEDFDLVAG
ncbi:MAG: hypothetical protein ABIP58_08980 [Dehalococcoidia bacterium]